MSSRDRLGPAVITLGAAGVLVGTFRPWVVSGRVNRSSYQIFEVVERLGFTPGGPLGWAVRLWPVVPLLMVCAVAASWFRYRVAAVTLGAVGSLYAGAVGAAVSMAPREGLVHVLGAPLFTAVAAAVVLAGAIVELANRRSSPWAR